VSAFLAQERDFLQGLAALVQGHAESVKAMAKRGRQAASAASAAASASGAETGASSQTSGAPAGSAELARTQRVTTADEPIRDEPIRVDEPQAATQTPSRSRTKPAGDQQNDSLRELFWGEDGES
jgi:hypothetical protein